MWFCAFIKKRPVRALFFLVMVECGSWTLQDPLDTRDVDGYLGPCFVRDGA